ncbi:DNA replication protein [Brevibacillus laterosporus]|uniref:DNA replication protein n=1 Tax=Brevibacillus laterosporus TaxID=1465 RepID=A0A518V9F3_BRELA|nr:DNA replication protein [Brevibacillus laterosporus]
MTNAPNCILREPCRQSTDPTACTRLCPSFIAMHGASGIGGRVAAACIPSDYAFVTVETAPPRVDQRGIYTNIERYITTFIRQFNDDSERIKSLYLFSYEPGTGKTTTAVAIANAYLTTHYIGSIQRGLQPLQRPVFFLDVNEWQTLFNQFNRPRVPDHVAEPASGKYYEWMKHATNAPFVVLDDIGVRDATDAFRGDLHTIINHRVTNRMPTVYTSNLPMDELAEVFDERLADRVRDQCAQLMFYGESKRGLRK